MKFSVKTKITGFLILSSLVVSVFLVLISIFTLQRSQKENVRLFKEEFLELSRELFNANSDLFFDFLSFRGGDEGKSAPDGQEMIRLIKEIDPGGRNAFVIGISDREYLEGYGNAEFSSLLSESLIEKYLNENTLNLTTDFDLDNFSEFVNDATGTVTPSKIHLRIYRDPGFIVGYGDVFSAGKVRVQFIQNQNEELFFSYLLLLLIFFSGVAVIAVILASSFMKIVIIKPLEKINSGLEKIKGGKLGTKIDIKRGDEFGWIAESFNEMTSSLEKSYRELDESRREEQVLRRRLQVIMQSMGDGIFVVDGDMKIVLFNRAAEEISGWKSEEAIGKVYGEVLKFVYEKDKNKINDGFIKEAIRKKDVVKMSNHSLLITRDGREIPVADSAAPLKDKSGEIYGCVVVFRDVTKEREVDKAKTEFISVASHQLRTPLTAIKLFVEMLMDGRKGELNEGQMEYMSDVRDSVRRMVKLVNNLLNISRLESGKVEIEPRMVSLSGLIAEAVEKLSSLAKSYRCDMTFKKPEGDPVEAYVDPELLHQVIQNLLSNAIRYSGKGRSKAKVEVELKERKDDYLVSVKDNGIGISGADREKMFQKFFRADNARRRVTEGSGLGLYVSKMIVEVSGGKIWFESEGEDKGTCFYVTIPKKGGDK